MTFFLCSVRVTFSLPDSTSHKRNVLSSPTLASVSPNQGVRGTTVGVTLTGTNFVVGATTVTVSGSGVTITDVTVGSGTSLVVNSETTFDWKDDRWTAPVNFGAQQVFHVGQQAMSAGVFAQYFLESPDPAAAISALAGRS